MNLIIKPQNYPTADGECPLTYAIYLQTENEEIFLAYSWTQSGAERAVKEIEKHST